jgi:signal transduction histidine kinase
MDFARILVVEDDESTLKSLNLIFRRKGYQVDLATSGSKALQMAGNEIYNLAIVDIRLPDMNGTALVKPFKERNPQASIIMVTGYASLETAVQALNNGAEAYIIKPLNVELVLATIQQVLEKQHLADEKRQAETALRENEKRLKVLHDLDYAILSQPSSKEIARAGLEHLSQLVSYRLGFVTLFEKKNQEMYVLATYPNDYDTDWIDDFFVLDLEMINVLKAGEVLTIDDPKEMVRDPNSLRGFISKNFHSILVVPLVAQGELMGSLNLGCEKETIIANQNIQIATEVARPMSIAIKQANLMDQVLLGRERLQILSKQILDVQEAERRALALELHDQIGQTLTAIKISLQSARRLKDISLIGENLDNCIDSVDLTLQEVRDLALNLRPSMLDDLGLEAALRWLVDRQAQSAGLIAEYNFETGSSRPAPEIETACFRVAQEAITNVLRHAEATRISIGLIQDDQFLALMVRDNGKGFDVPLAMDAVVSGKSLGLLGMFERTEIAGGSLEIDSKIGEGTTYCAKFPLMQVSSLNKKSMRLQNG